MNQSRFAKLSRRERQIMDVLYRLQEGSVQEVLEQLPDAPSYSTVRALLARLLEKQLVVHRQDGARYIYAPAVAMSEAQDSALQRLVNTFFEGSVAKAVNALLGSKRDTLTAEELAEIQRAIAAAQPDSSSSKDNP